MTTLDFITERFCQVDNRLKGAPKHPQAGLWPSEVVTLAMRPALKGVGTRAFSRWLVRDSLTLFPRLPKRSRLLRWFQTPWRGSSAFMANLTLLERVMNFQIKFEKSWSWLKFPRIGTQSLFMLINCLV